MQAEALLCPACIDRGLKRHEKTGSVLNVSAQNSPKIIHKMKGENRQMEYEFMTAATPLPPCMPFPKALAGLPISSTAKVMYCKMLDAMITKKLEDENGILFVYFPVRQLAAELSRCEMTVKRSLNELENVGLIMRVRRWGFAELNRIYILIPKI
jgi:hypothetical protein